MDANLSPAGLDKEQVGAFLFLEFFENWSWCC